MVRYTRLPSPLGRLLVTDHGAGLSGLYFPDHRRGPTVATDWVADADHFAPVAAQLDAYFAGRATGFDLPLDLRGTPFQRTVWQALRAVPHGTTTTYGRLAADIGRPRAVRAVAGAVARNPVAIVVGCHRVTGADGRPTGFAGGTARKRWLLAHEGAGHEGRLAG